MMTDSVSTGFSVNSEESGFNSRCNDVFAGLATLEKKHDALDTVRSRKRSNEERSRLQRPDPLEDTVEPHEGRPFFKNPHGRAPRRLQHSAGFKKDPKKWISYDLSDVSPDQLSDKGNKAAALAFLQERQKAREGDNTDETAADLNQKVQFSYRPSVDGSKPEASDSSDTKFCGGKLVMPEYDMGQRMAKPKHKWRKIDKSAATGSAAVNLDYLERGDHEVDETTEVIPAVSSEGSMAKAISDKTTLTTKEKVEGEMDTDTSSEAMSSFDSIEVKFKMKSGRKGIRQRKRDDGDDDDDDD